MTNEKDVFLIGPGFIGAEILDLLIADGYNVTTLTRREAYAKELQAVGAKTVLGSLSDSDLITEQSIQHGIILHTATADDLPSVQAVIEGVKTRSKKGLGTIYIHTSGTSQLSDDSEGGYKGDKVFSDATAKDIDALPDSASHREIDLAIIRARKELAADEKTRLAIILPPLIYGVGTRSRRLSIQLPTMTRFALKHGFAAHVGKGLSIWSQVHVADLARAYVMLIQWLENNNASAVSNPYFFCENGTELSWGECAAEIGRALHKAGRIKDPKPRTVPKEMYDEFFGMYTAWVIGSNSRSRAVRLRELGWQPKERGTLQSLSEDEIPIMLEEKGEFKGDAGVAASGSG